MLIARASVMEGVKTVARLQHFMEVRSQLVPGVSGNMPQPFCGAGLRLTQ